MNDRYIIVFDGVCNLCNGAVNFIIKYDPCAKFAFTPMQSKLAKKLIEKYKINNVGIDTFLLIKNGECFIWTNAAFEITKELSGYWYLLLFFKIIPRPVRDAVYRLLARNRYTLFGRQTYCLRPTADVINRFIGV